MSIHTYSRRPIWIGSVIAGGALLLLPIAYMAGWLGDLGQVQPTLSALSQARQNLAWQESHQPHEPPVQTPVLTVSWTDSSVTLNWKRVTGASRYDVYRAPAHESFGQAQVIGQVTQQSAMVSYTDTSVLPGQAYAYWVSAVNGAGQGPSSSALTVQVFESWPTITHMVISATNMATAIASTKTAWGILGNVSHATNVPFWNIGGILLTPYQFPSSADQSTWLKSRSTSWQIGPNAATSTPWHGLSQIHDNAVHHIPKLESGTPTPQDMVLWQSQGHWITALISNGTEPVPPDGLIVNQYGTVVGISNSAGRIIPIPRG